MLGHCIEYTPLKLNYIFLIYKSPTKRIAHSFYRVKAELKKDVYSVRGEFGGHGGGGGGEGGRGCQGNGGEGCGERGYD